MGARKNSEKLWERIIKLLCIKKFIFHKRMKSFEILPKSISGIKNG